MSVTTPSKLQKMLAAGHFAVTSEVGPPRSADGAVIEHKGNLIKDYVDAINVTDNQTSVCRMCSLACCIRLKLMGLEPVCRWSPGTGTASPSRAISWGRPPSASTTSSASPATTSTSATTPSAPTSLTWIPTQLIQTVKMMRDEGQLLGGYEFEVRPQMFIGAAANPFAGPNVAMRVARLAKKAAAGVQFIQTQCIYNMDKFKEFMKMAVDRGLHEKVAILAGITPMKNVGMAKYMQKRVPGMDVPDEIVQAHRRRPQGKAGRRGHQPGGGADRGTEERAGHPGLPHHGHRVGGKGPGNRANGPASIPGPSA